ncbi:MAG: hypothetical protein P8182_16215 [Deltaproteobacteria bacterium]
MIEKNMAQTKGTITGLSQWRHTTTAMVDKTIKHTVWIRCSV